MLHRLFAFVLLAALFVQSAAAFGPVIVAQRSADIEHVMVHGQDTNHHHHSDASLHIDDEGNVQHSHPDYSSGSAALLYQPNPPLTVPGVPSRVEARPALWHSATVDGLLRPPIRRV